jgi:hypothetical protein
MSDHISSTVGRNCQFLIKGSMPTAAAAAATTTKQNVNPAVYFVYSRVKSYLL